MRPRRRRLVTGALLIPLALGVVSCGPDGPDAYTAPVEAPDATDVTLPPDDPGDDTVEGAPADSVPANGQVVDVRALDNTFIDEVIEVDAGTEVRWENRGRNDHDVIPVADGETWGVALEDFTPGDAYSHVFSVPGTYRYYCTVHGTEDVGMVGAVVVT